jgi:hypothetical protein
MLKYVWLPVIAVLFFLLSGCAMMDVAMQENAVPLEPGEVEITPYATLGVPVYIMLDNDKAQTDKDIGPTVFAGVMYAVYGTGYGARISASILPGLDISGRFYMAGLGINGGAKLGIKKLLLQKTGKEPKSELPLFMASEAKPPYHTLVAVQPSLNAMFPIIPDNSTHEERITSAGIECQLLLSRYRDLSRITTLGLRLGYNRFWYETIDQAANIKDKVFLDLSWNKKYQLGRISLTPSIGCSFFNTKDVWLWPHLGLGLGYYDMVTTKGDKPEILSN